MDLKYLPRLYEEVLILVKYSDVLEPCWSQGSLSNNGIWHETSTDNEYYEEIIDWAPLPRR